MNEQDLRGMIEGVRSGRIDRRAFIRRLAMVGITAPMAAQLLTHSGVAMAQTATAYKPTKAGGGGTLKVLWWQAPTLLNPHFANGTKDQDGSRVFYEPLAAWNADGELVPVLAASVPSRENGGLAADGKSVFFVSDRTAITAEMLGHSLLAQFEDVQFKETTLPFVDSVERASKAVLQINEATIEDGTRPLVFSTLVDPDVSAVIARANALYLDCFQVFISPMEQELGVRHSLEIGRSHRVRNTNEYHSRIEAVNFCLAHDDGVSTKELHEADVILVGVSRSGKTPTCLYMLSLIHI